MRLRIAVCSYIGLGLGCLSACEAEPESPQKSLGTAVDRGRLVFSDAGSAFACATCHPAEEPLDHIYPGRSLAGVVARPTFWGGTRLSLLEAINDCRSAFMGRVAPWTSTDDEARAMWAYLESQPGDGKPLTFSLPTNIVDLPPGDENAGKALFVRACAHCHAPARPEDRVGPRLPEDVIASHANATQTELRLIFITKIRRGAFTDLSGRMPPFSREVLSDDDTAAVLSALGLYR